MNINFPVKIRVVICVLLCAPVFWAVSQEESREEIRGEVIYAAGSGFELVRDGDTREYDLSAETVEGMDLFSGDYINTYGNTFLEIQTLPSQNLLKVSENTSFKVQELTEQGGGSFELTYGRVRAKVEKMAGLEKFSIKGPSMVAGVRGTDFGYDIVYGGDEEKERTVALVYCFEGEVDVATEEETETAEMVIGEDEMVSLVEKEE
ncbi:MAG: FecR domain-containing protein, partial [Spirochaetia bacterium]